MICLLDDLRNFKETPSEEVLIFRTSEEAMKWLESDREPISQFWFDHDLGGDDTATRVVTEFSRLAFEGTPVEVEHILVHSANIYANGYVDSLRRYGYKVTRVRAEDYMISEVPHD